MVNTLDTQPLAVGTVLKGRYRVTRLLGGGGMAWVYETEETLPNGQRRTLALKELRAETRDPAALVEAQTLFEQEATLLVGLNHPNLPEVSAYFQENGRSYLVMEFVYGESLARKQDLAQAPLLESQVLDWAIQICTVLDYLHRQPQPIIFRDMKPSNVMITPDGRVKLIDFGIARVYKQGKNRDTVVMGSENYAAPEQWGKAQSDPRTDLYGLGATLYHLLTHVPPLPAFVPGERARINQYNPAVSAATVAVVEKAMATAPSARYASAQEMRQALLDCLPLRERLLLVARQRLRDQAAAPPERPAVRETAVQTVTAAVTGTGPGAAVLAGPACVACGTANRPTARYCQRCGESLAPIPPARLSLVTPPKAEWRYTLSRPATLIGRPQGSVPVDLDLSACDPEGYVSRNHARVQRVGRRYQLTDLGSANGTFINGYRLTPQAPYWLRHGDHIRMGQVVLAFSVR